MAAVLSVTHAQTVQREGTPAGRGDLARFREEFYGSLTARADALFELTDAVLCADGPVRSLVDLTLVAEHRRGHGAMYDALNRAGWNRRESADPWRSLSRFPCKPRVANTINLSQGESSWEEDDQRVQRCFPAVSSSSRFPSSLAGNVAQPEVE